MLTSDWRQFSFPDEIRTPGNVNVKHLKERASLTIAPFLPPLLLLILTTIVFYRNYATLNASIPQITRSYNQFTFSVRVPVKLLHFPLSPTTSYQKWSLCIRQNVLHTFKQCPPPVPRRQTQCPSRSEV